MSRLELSISPNYVRWGRWEAIREIMQNAKDAEDMGHPMSAWHEIGKDGPVLVVTNETAVLPRESLVLGTSTKQENSQQRGEFGEGYKLALATLLRLKCKVIIFNGNELWEPNLEFSENFNTKVLVINISTLSALNHGAAGGLEIHIAGITVKDWEQAQQRLLFLPGCQVGQAISCENGRVLLDPRHAGLLYSKGIYVGNPDLNLRYGYDLDDVKLDRDRRLADPYSLKLQIKNIISDAIGSEEMPSKVGFDLLNSDSGEASIFEQCYLPSGDMHAVLQEYFNETYGDKAVPVESMGDSMEAEFYGLKGVVASRTVRHLLSKVRKPYRDLKGQKATEIRARYSFQDMTYEEKTNLVWAQALVVAIDKGAIWDNINVVDFVGPKICGLYVGGDIKIARRILTDRKELIATLVHEVSHAYGKDGSVQHVTAEERIFSHIICKLSPLKT